MSKGISRNAAVRYFLLLGVSRFSKIEGKPSRARDEAAAHLVKNIRALRNIGVSGSVSLENLDDASLLPARISNVVRTRKRFGANENESFLFRDIAEIAEADFQYFHGLRNIGEHYTLVLRSIQDIYMETGRFRNLPKLDSLSIGEIGESEQEALIKRVTECIRRDPAVRGALFQLFPPRTPKP